MDQTSFTPISWIRSGTKQRVWHTYVTPALEGEVGGWEFQVHPQLIVSLRPARDTWDLVSKKQNKTKYWILSISNACISSLWFLSIAIFWDCRPIKDFNLRITFVFISYYSLLFGFLFFTIVLDILFLWLLENINVF